MITEVVFRSFMDEMYVELAGFNKSQHR